MSNGNILEHECANPKLYILTDVTVWIRVFKDGRIGGMRDRREHIAKEAMSQVGSGDDVVCATCGAMGKLP